MTELNQLVRRVRDTADSAADADRVTEQVQVQVAAAAHEVTVPPHLLEHQPGGYSRRLLHHEPGRCAVLAITWGPGAQVPLHDHGGCWGVEGTLCGQMQVRPYRLAEPPVAGRYRLAAGDWCTQRAGDVDVLVPPDEYHEVANRTSAVAVTLHVYRELLLGCFTYHRSRGPFFVARRRRLALDD